MICASFLIALMPSAHQQATPQGSIWHSPAATGRRRSMLPTGNLCSKASTAPGTPANLLQRLAASTQQDEDTYLLQKRYVYSLLSSLLCVAGSCLVFTWFAVDNQRRPRCWQHCTSRKCQTNDKVGREKPSACQPIWLQRVCAHQTQCKASCV